MLSLPLAFILSQDQTLRCIKIFNVLSSSLLVFPNSNLFRLFLYYLHLSLFNIFKERFKIPAFIPINFNKVGDDLLSRFIAVPLALLGLTSLFGMGRGGTPMLKSP